MGFFIISSANTLAQVYQGPLRVIVHTLRGFTEEFQKDLRPEIVGGDSTLFEYVGNACACIFTNMTTRLQVETCPNDWEVIRFDPQKRILEVRQISGPDLLIEPDDQEKLVTPFFPASEL